MGGGGGGVKQTLWTPSRSVTETEIFCRILNIFGNLILTVGFSIVLEMIVLDSLVVALLIWKTIFIQL